MNRLPESWSFASDSLGGRERSSIIAIPKKSVSLNRGPFSKCTEGGGTLMYEHLYIYIYIVHTCLECFFWPSFFRPRMMRIPLFRKGRQKRVCVCVCVFQCSLETPCFCTLGSSSKGQNLDPSRLRPTESAFGLRTGQGICLSKAPAVCAWVCRLNGRIPHKRG